MKRSESVLDRLPSRGPHPFYPDALGTTCAVWGCWGWVDDPRHLPYETRPPVIHLPRDEKPVRISNRWARPRSPTG